MGGMFGGGGGGSVQAVKPPKPLKIKIGRLEKQMIGADQAAYAAGDQYMNKYYPSLRQARDQMIQQSYKALVGPLDPTLERSFVNTANMQSLGALGGGDQGFGLSKGSLARNAAAATVATEQQAYQDYNRNLFQQLNATYAPRSFGMTPEDAANLFTFNNTQYNNYLQQKFAAATQAYYSNQAAAAQSGAAGAGLIGQLGSAAIGGLAAY
jgi:hypothetical protein